MQCRKLWLDKKYYLLFLASMVCIKKKKIHNANKTTKPSWRQYRRAVGSQTLGCSCSALAYCQGPWGAGGAVGSPLPPGPCSDPPSQIWLPPSKLLNGEHRLLQLKPGPILGKQSGVFSKTGPGSTAQPSSDHRGCFHPVFLGERRPARCLPVPPSSGPGRQSC